MASAGIIARNFVLAAGGTGGHMIPAYALGEELARRGHNIALVTDERGARIPGLFDEAEVHILPAGRMAGGPAGWLRAAYDIWTGRRMAKRLYRRFRPAAVVGFGGYPSLPALSAAHALGIPTMVHEQNAVLGRVNRLFAGKVDAIATAYQKVERLNHKYLAKTYLIGNPVREAVLALRDEPYPALSEDGVFRLLVIGGSQGATILSHIVPDGLSKLPIEFRRRLQVTQQCRPEDIEEVRAQYARHNIPAELATYFTDIPMQLARAHLVIARAGASTIAELTAAGRPAILIPFAAAADDHQSANAREMVGMGGARMIAEASFTPDELARQMLHLGLEPKALANAAAYARAAGHPDAARDLADLVERIGRTPAATPMSIRTWQPALLPERGAVA